jgi:hypothetical protein
MTYDINNMYRFRPSQKSYLFDRIACCSFQKRQFLTDMEIMDSLIHYEHLYIHVCFISINFSLLSAKKHLVRLPNFRWGPCCLVFCFCLFLFSWLCIWIVHSRFPLLFPLNLFTYTISQRHHLSGATVFCYINARFVMYE